MKQKGPIGLFEAFGVELEYMIVAADTLSILPAADRVLFEVAGAYEAEVDLGEISWSNELALHVLELKTTSPETSLDPLPSWFHEHVTRVNGLLAPSGARLMPTAMHPWMDPHREMRLWPHDYNAVYEAFHRVFDCRGHGWANLQSVHLNLPFADDREFGRLHAAVRLLLPILPALAASSPIVEGRVSGLCDSRLDFYRANAARIPSVTGAVIPEAVFSREEYQSQIFGPMYADIARHDPDGTLQHEWLNARGAIARFERNTIEIRVLDVQECPQADLAICAATVAVLRALAARRWAGLAEQQSVETERLARIFLNTIRDAEKTVIDDPEFLRVFRCTAPLTAGELWYRLLDESSFNTETTGGNREALRVILDEGPLARRILQRLDGDVSTSSLALVYRDLCNCLADGRMFRSKG